MSKVWASMLVTVAQKSFAAVPFACHASNGLAGHSILYLGQRPEVPHVYPPRRRVRDVVRDAALRGLRPLVLAP